VSAKDTKVTGIVDALVDAAEDAGSATAALLVIGGLVTKLVATDLLPPHLQVIAIQFCVAIKEATRTGATNRQVNPVSHYDHGND
jgi:uncharacterized protein YejL (UPF0352 family)